MQVNFLSSKCMLLRQEGYQRWQSHCFCTVYKASCFAGCEELTYFWGKVVRQESFYWSLEAGVMHSPDSVALPSTDFNLFIQAIPSSHWKSRKKYKLPSEAQSWRSKNVKKIKIKSTNATNFEVFNVLIISPVPLAVWLPSVITYFLKEQIGRDIQSNSRNDWQKKKR